MTSITTLVERARGCLLGLAAGDAVGTTVEFKPPGTFDPVVDMTGGGIFQLEAGQWTDDTSMALCLGYSLVKRGGFDAHDQMNRYLRWYREGYMSVNGRCFDIGNTCRGAIEQFESEGDPLCGDPSSGAAGNGSIMRLAPVVLFYAESPDLLKHCALSSKTTHGTEAAVRACEVLGLVIQAALLGREKAAVLEAAAGLPDLPGALRHIADGRYMNKNPGEIEGQGYVVKSLEAALWCFWKTQTFEDAILTAANLGHDADTTAAVCGQVAGAYYGVGGIPEKWLAVLAWRDEIEELADRCLKGGGR